MHAHAFSVSFPCVDLNYKGSPESSKCQIEANESSRFFYVYTNTNHNPLIIITMKTTSTILCLLFSVALTAQVTNLPTVLQVNDEGENAFSVVPKQLSYDGSNRVYIRTADDQIAIYDNDFTPVKSITITPTRSEEIYITKEREVTVTVNTEDNVTFEYGEWVEVERREYNRPRTSSIGFTNYDANPTHHYMFETGDGVCLTQTLFNSDDKYEYLYFPHELSEEYDYVDPTPDYYESGTYTEEEIFYQYSLYKSFNVMSEDGAILQTVTFPNGFQMADYLDAQVIQLSEEFYILCQGGMNDYTTLLIYKINRSSVGASVEQVCAPIKVGAFPSVANRNQMITIQLSGDNAGNNQTNLQVVDMQGKVMNQQTIPAGQTSTTIPAHRLSNGMNLIKITQGSKTIGTEKVIVK